MTNQYNSFVDNSSNNTMAKAVREVFGLEIAEGAATTNALPQEVRIASAFFSPSGFRLVAPALQNISNVRLMLGADMPSDLYANRRPAGESEERWRAGVLRNQLDNQKRSIERERNLLPFSTEYNQALRVLVSSLRQGNLQVRRYEKNFLHAKAYIFTNSDDEGGILAGSSNLTQAGLTTNMELNLGRFDQPTWHKATKWFDALWEEAVPLELADLYESSLQLQNPWYIFLRVLYQLYGDELELDKEAGDDLSLTTFQKHGVARASRLIQANGGVIVADEVGLGKTFIAGEIMKRYTDRGQRALLICPAALRDSTWKHFLAQYRIYCECYSYHQLGKEKQLGGGSSEHLQVQKDLYQLIIIDEAHNYRNPAAPTLAGALSKLLGDRRKDLLMLTATPVNNSLWDLHTLLGYFIREDSHFANQNILSIKGRFKRAMAIDPTHLNPDVLYPIIDATTVKRTRQFVQNHYHNDTITTPDGKTAPIVFPDPIPRTVRYDMEQTVPGLMDKVFLALDPDTEDDPATLTLARYRVLEYEAESVSLKDKERHQEEIASARAATYLMRSALLKRFESSAHAFQATLKRIQEQCEICLEALEKGLIVSTAFLSEISGDDEAALEELLERSDRTYDAANFDAERLKQDLTHDVELLEGLVLALRDVEPETDAKLIALRTELEQIATEAEEQATSDLSAGDLRKVLIFSSFADTVSWIHDFLQEEIASNPRLKVLRERIGRVTGRQDEDDLTRDQAVYGFAPISMSIGQAEGREDLYDVLVTTDVLAEGVNLQQCRHIINYDLPWNPMRLVQRHGRIDRIGSKHPRVFLRSIFPDKQLDKLLNLEKRILQKIAMAAVSIGVQKPIAQVKVDGNQNFTETREEIEQLMAENPELYRRGGVASAAQSGEEYRQTLRKALEIDRERIENMPWKVGSGMAKGKERGVFFCADIDEITHLCFVRAGEDWQPKDDNNGEEEDAIEAELGTCLRLIEAREDTPLLNPMPINEERICAFWDKAQEYFYAEWEKRTDPANLTPSTRPLNRLVIDFLEQHQPESIADERLLEVNSILASEWSRRDENRLRQEFDSDEHSGKDKARHLIDWVGNTGILPLQVPDPFPPIDRLDIKLVCWMVIEPVTAAPANG